MPLFVTSDNGTAHLPNFLIGASVALVSACLSSLGVNLQALALKAERELNLFAESSSSSGSLYFIDDNAGSPCSLGRGSSTGSARNSLATGHSLYTEPEEESLMSNGSTFTTTDGAYATVNGASDPGSSSLQSAHSVRAGRGRRSTVVTVHTGSYESFNGHTINVMPPGSVGSPAVVVNNDNVLTTSSSYLNSKSVLPAASSMPNSGSTKGKEVSSRMDYNRPDLLDADSDLHPQSQRELPPSATTDTTAPLPNRPSPLICSREMGIFTMLALLLNLQQARISRPLTLRERSQLWKRLYASTQWYLGFSLYLICQLFGSVVALGFISPVVLAPLGSAGLIFNIVFSSFFVGTQITRYDWGGTVLIVIGCAVVSTFGSSMPDDRQSIDDIIKLYSRPAFIAYFSVQLTLVICTFSLIKYLEFSLFFMRSLIVRSSTGSHPNFTPTSQYPVTHTPLLPHQSPISPAYTSTHSPKEQQVSESLEDLEFTETISPGIGPFEQIESNRRVAWTDSSQSYYLVTQLSDGPCEEKHVSQNTTPLSINASSAGVYPTSSSNCSGVGRDIHMKNDISATSNLDPVISTNPDTFDTVGSLSRNRSISLAISTVEEEMPLLLARDGRGSTVTRDSISMRSITVRVKRGQLTSLVGVLYAIVGGITASETLLLTKSGVELIFISIFDANNQFQGAFSFILLALLALTIFLQLYSLNKALHYSLPVFVIPIFYTLFTCLSLANSMVYLDAFGVYLAADLLFLILGIVLIVTGVWLLGKSHDESSCEDGVSNGIDER
ncbi:hypothetical protein BASA61_010333 [Batrachochytrium salamandrivorans]|nr:hypothetical protein BASA60_005321 [Batrachochytrium salamandrivorans]KAH6579308.1 hypothetical protein BASA61_010333 [Batrachochytrium salamandrivorans]